jgi:hypothetical protein
LILIESVLLAVFGREIASMQAAAVSRSEKDAEQQKKLTTGCFSTRLHPNFFHTVTIHLPPISSYCLPSFLAQITDHK